MRRQRVAWSVAAAMVAATAACATPPETPPDEAPRPGALAAPDEGVTPVRAERPGALMSGALAAGSREDLLLAHEDGRYLIERNKDAPEQDTPDRDAWVVPGAVVDAVATSGGDDGLIALTPLIGLEAGPLQRVIAQDVRTAEGSQGGAVLSRQTVELGGTTVEVTTRAVLARGLPHLVLKTTARNVGKQAVQLRLGDRLVFGGGAAFTAAGQRLAPGQVKTPWLGHEALPGAYGYTLDGAATLEAEVHAADHGARTYVTAVDAVGLKKRLAPGEEATLVRRFKASGRGMADVRAWLAELGGAPTGSVYGKIEAPRGLPPEAFRVVLRQGDRLVGHLPVSSGFALDARLPAGSYRAAVEGPWGLSAAPQALEVPRGGSARLEANLGALGAARVKVQTGGKRPLPLPATVVVTDAQRRPVSLGHTGRGLANGPLLHLPQGEGDLWLPPGRYTLTATRGPAYGLDTAEIEIPAPNPDRAAAAVEVTLRLERVLDTRGFLLADLRTYPSSADMAGLAMPDDLAQALVAAGVELAAFTPRARGASPEGVAQRLGLKGLLALPGQEIAPLTPDFGAFTVLPARDTAGARLPPLSGRTPEALLSELPGLGAAKEPFITVIGPRAASGAGYFDRFMLDRDSGAFTSPGASAAFGGVEILGGGALGNPCLLADLDRCSGDQKNLARAVEEGVRDWGALIQQGMPVTATAASGSRAPGLEPVGVPFTWIEAETPGGALDALKNLRAVPSTGPLVRFTIEGRHPGQLAPGLKRVQRAGKTVIIRGARVEIDVQAVAWAAFDEVTLYQDGAPVERWEVEPAIKDGVQRFTTSLTVKPEVDSWYYVRVSGKRSLPTLPHLPTRPFAMSNPVWVDGNGDGAWKRTPPAP